MDDTSTDSDFVPLNVVIAQGRTTRQRRQARIPLVGTAITTPAFDSSSDSDGPPNLTTRTRTTQRGQDNFDSSSDSDGPPNIIARTRPAQPVAAATDSTATATTRREQVVRMDDNDNNYYDSSSSSSSSSSSDNNDSRDEDEQINLREGISPDDIRVLSQLRATQRQLHRDTEIARVDREIARLSSLARSSVNAQIDDGGTTSSSDTPLPQEASPPLSLPSIVFHQSAPCQGWTGRRFSPSRVRLDDSSGGSPPATPRREEIAAARLRFFGNTGAGTGTTRNTNSSTTANLIEDSNDTNDNNSNNNDDDIDSDHHNNRFTDTDTIMEEDE